MPTTSPRHRRARPGDLDQGRSASQSGSPGRGASRRLGDDRQSLHETLQPKSWPKPKGYANGVKARGAAIYVGGQVGWDDKERFPKGFVPQAKQALENIVSVLREGGAKPHHLVRMTWYVLDMDEYLDARRELGGVYREVIGDHFPAMALVQVGRLFEKQARLEIEATAVVP